jgi:aquaporin Z
VDNTSVNPARSLAPALFAGGDALSQLWVFIVAPVVGGILAGVTYGLLFGERRTADLQDSFQA